MRNKNITFAACLLAASSFSLSAQNSEPLKLKKPAGHASAILVNKDTIKVDYPLALAQLSFLSDQDCKATVASGSEDMIQVKESKGDLLTLLVEDNYSVDERVGKVTLTTADGSCSRDVVVLQSGNTSAKDLPQDYHLAVASATANQAQGGYGIENSYDGDFNTLYHSPFGNPADFPVVLTYNLKSPSHVDYLIYTPRSSAGGQNGNFGEVKVYCATSDNPSEFKLVAQKDLEQSSSSSTIDLGENGVDQVVAVRLEVLSGYGNFASCAEMAFYTRNHELDGMFSPYFEDALCTRLKPGVDEAAIAKIANPYVKMLAYNVFADPTYSESKYRIGTFEAYETLSTLASRLKVSAYNAYENPTGLYFEAGKPLVVFVEGIGEDPVSLKIKNFGQAYEGEPQDESTYSLKNGINVITPLNRGNGYVSYYTDNYKNAPSVKMHFALATENGYFDLERGDTNEDWIKLLKNAKSDIIDLRTKRVQLAYPKARFEQYCPENGVELALLSDSTIYYERDIMGLLGEKEPKNRQFARVVWGGFMFADGIGAAAHDNSLEGWMNPSKFEPWGLAHELGHVNQVRPGLKWVGCGETTNNIYSAWVEHKLEYRDGYHRLESEEYCGVNDYTNLRGGRFNVYLEDNVRKGIPFLLADGPNYFGSVPEERIVKNEDYEGNVGGDTLIYIRNYDHFVKLVPFWQLQLYGQEAGYAPNVFGKVVEALRKDSDEGLTNGMLQMRFMRLVCDSTGLNFLPFFEKAGMLLPINRYIEDYSPGWMKISQSMIDDLKKHVADAGFPTPEGEINYISAKNWKIYRDRLSLVAGNINEGCEQIQDGSLTRIKVSHDVWQNVVAFETYDADGHLLRISMGGLGEASETGYSYTQVLWPQTETEKAAYIMAVGWDGTRIKCYEK